MVLEEKFQQNTNKIPTHLVRSISMNDFILYVFLIANILLKSESLTKHEITGIAKTTPRVNY